CAGHDRDGGDARSGTDSTCRPARHHARAWSPGRGRLTAMKHALQYAFDEAVASLWRGRHSGLLSTSTIGLALFVLGGFLLATANLQHLGDEWSRSAEMSVYLAEDASLAQRTAIEGVLAPGPLVAGAEYVSKATALDRFKQTFADLA